MDVREIRKAWQWTVPEMARVLGVSVDAVYRLERGVTRPTSKRRVQLETLARARAVVVGVDSQQP